MNYKESTYDNETTGLNPYIGNAEMFSFSVFDRITPKVFRLDGDKTKSNEKYLKEFWNDISIIKIMHNARFDMKFTEKYGIFIPDETIIHDTMVLSQYMQNLHPSHKLAELGYELADYPKTNDELVKEHTKGGISYQKVPVHIMEPYQIDDVIRPMLLFDLWIPEIRKDKRMYERYLIEMELIKLTIDIQDKGIMLHEQEADKMLNWLEDEISKIHNDLYQITKERTNLSSPIQVRYLLFDKMGMKPIKETKTGYSTDKETIFELRKNYEDEKESDKWLVIDLLSKYRSYAHARPIIKSYFQYADDKKIIHCNINTNRDKTGRQSITKPPLHGVSKSESLLNPYSVPARKLFRARPNHVIFSFDWAGIEMRLCAIVSQDGEMIDVFKKDLNPHVVAAKIFYEDEFKSKKENKILYDATKNAHFGIPYGIGIDEFAKLLGLSKDIAVIRKGNYNNRFTRISKMSKVLSIEAKKFGYIETLFGRKLFVPQDKFYSAADYEIQGTGADMLKIILVKIGKYLKDKWNNEIYIILHSHDEIFIECPRKLLKYRVKFIPEINGIFTDFDFEIPIKSEWKMTTTTWFNAKEIEV